jgi:MoaA/NifB/PqqE/SkfB family radical SAM enzyme
MTAVVGRDQEHGPWRITFDTNPDDCNLHCIMCEEFSEFSQSQVRRRADGRPPRRMDPRLIRKVVEEASRHGLREIIPSTMGEPLLYKDFEYILALCGEFGVKLNLTTNGTFPRKSVAEWARLIVPVASDVKISWNGSKAETAESIMKGAKFERVLDNVRRFIHIRDELAPAGVGQKDRCRVTFQMTFLERNIQDLPDIVKLAAEIGVDRVKGHHLWVHFSQIQELSMRRSAAAVARWNEVVLAAQEAVEKYRLQDGRKVILENIFPLDATSDQISQDAVCPFLGKEAWVSAEGRFNPCCAPDQLRRTLGDFGNLNEKRLMETWEGTAYRDLVANYLNNSLCRTCNMRRPQEFRSGSSENYESVLTLSKKRMAAR